MPSAPPDHRRGSLPPSALFVRSLLERNGGELSRQTLIDRTGLPAGTVDTAIDQLEDAGVVIRARSAEDLRQTTVLLDR